jgi:hypothetical protein
MPENSDREVWTDQLAGPRVWTARLKSDGTRVQVRHVGMVLGVVGPWRIVGGPRDGKYVADRDLADLARS